MNQFRSLHFLSRFAKKLKRAANIGTLHRVLGGKNSRESSDAKRRVWVRMSWGKFAKA